MNGVQNFWLIVLSLLATLALTVWPLPLDVRWWRPDWVLLMVVFWVLATPHRFGLVSAWLCGLALDIVRGAPLGENAFALVIVAHAVALNYQKMRMDSGLQQSVMIFVLVCFHQLVGMWALGLQGISYQFGFGFFASALTTAMVWPFLRGFVSLAHTRLHPF